MKEQVLEFLSNKYEALDIIQINDGMNLKTVDELKQLEETISLLIEECLLYETKKQKYILFKNMSNIKVGKISLTKKGNGYLVLPNEDDVFINRPNLNGAIDEDTVMIEVYLNGFDKEGKVLKILKRDLTTVQGEVIKGSKSLEIKLDDHYKDLKLEIAPWSFKDCVEGHIVSIKLKKQINNRKYLGEIIKIICHKTDPQSDILMLADKYKIPEDFSEEAKIEATNIPKEVLKTELNGRRDLTDELIYTIDGDDTKDIDDAISISKDGDNYILKVSIADVSHYVKPKSSLDKDAFARGNSYYLADTVIPMLPRELSNGICSLNEKVLRLSLTCEMKIDSKGNVFDFDIYESYINSKKKMTYKKVNDILMRNIVDPEYEEYKDNLLLANELAKIGRKNLVRRGYIDFEIDETKIIQDENGKCIDVQRRVREDGEMLIEIFMIYANETVANCIYNMDLPFLYRIHDLPDQEKIESFLNLIKLLGYKLTSRSNDFSNKGLQNILEEIRDKKEFPILSKLLLRSMKKAGYATNNIGHFGLSSPCYTHFTSPIRRYSDLQVHRLLKIYLFLNDYSSKTLSELSAENETIALQTSTREKDAESCERDVEDMKKAEYMEDHIGEQYKGVITTVTNYGFYVELDNLIEGLVHVKSLAGDYYEYVEELLSLIGKSTKKTYRVGDEVLVKVIRADAKASEIDFELVGDENGSKK